MDAVAGGMKNIPAFSFIPCNGWCRSLFWKDPLGSSPPQFWHEAMYVVLSIPVSEV